MNYDYVQNFGEAMFLDIVGVWSDQVGVLLFAFCNILLKTYCVTIRVVPF